MDGINLMISFNHGILTPARSGNRGSIVFASAIGFPEQRASISVGGRVYASVVGRTVE